MQILSSQASWGLEPGHNALGKGCPVAQAASLILTSALPFPYTSQCWDERVKFQNAFLFPADQLDQVSLEEQMAHLTHRYAL